MTTDKETSIVTVGEAFDVMVEASGIVYKNARYLSRVTKPLIFVCVGLVLVVAALQFQLLLRDDRIEALEKTVATLDANVKSMQQSADQARQASIEAEVASEAAKKALEEAIVQSQSGPGAQTAQAIDRINDIYVICVEKKEC